MKSIIWGKKWLEATQGCWRNQIEKLVRNMLASSIKQQESKLLKICQKEHLEASQQKNLRLKKLEIKFEKEMG